MLKGSEQTGIKNWTQEGLISKNDHLAIELPLQIILTYPLTNKLINKNLVITMRTPGDDAVLAVGYLHAEGIINKKEDVKSVEQTDVDIIKVTLAIPLKKSQIQLSRSDISTGACGMCGKTSMDGIYLPEKKALPESPFSFNPEKILSLSEKSSQHQRLFEETGGIHASAFFNSEGTLISIFEDIGRHNSLDKLIGDRILKEDTNMSSYTLFVSGRAGFELIQKAIVADVRLLVSVGAPSSLAVQYAKEYGITLIGFLKNKSFNIYTYPERILS